MIALPLPVEVCRVKWWISWTKEVIEPRRTTTTEFIFSSYWILRIAGYPGREYWEWRRRIGLARLWNLGGIGGYRGCVLCIYEEEKILKSIRYSCQKGYRPVRLYLSLSLVLSIKPIYTLMEETPTLLIYFRFLLISISQFCCKIYIQLLGLVKQKTLNFKFVTINLHVSPSCWNNNLKTLIHKYFSVIIQ